MCSQSPAKVWEELFFVWLRKFNTVELPVSFYRVCLAFLFGCWGTLARRDLGRCLSWGSLQLVRSGQVLPPLGALFIDPCWGNFGTLKLQRYLLFFFSSLIRRHDLLLSVCGSLNLSDAFNRYVVHIRFGWQIWPCDPLFQSSTWYAIWYVNLNGGLSYIHPWVRSNGVIVYSHRYLRGQVQNSQTGDSSSQYCQRSLVSWSSQSRL